MESKIKTKLILDLQLELDDAKDLRIQLGKVLDQEENKDDPFLYNLRNLKRSLESSLDERNLY
jgi:hypothetical protein